MFQQKNSAAFQAVSRFLVQRKGGIDVIEKLKHCFPCQDRKQEAEFRRVIGDFIASLNKARIRHSCK